MQKYKNGKLAATNMANASEYNGLTERKSLGRGMGMGGRLGRGGGRYLSVGKGRTGFYIPIF